MASNTGTYGITGIPPPEYAKLRTKTIPYAPGMPLRREISTLFPSDDPLIQKQWTLLVLALEKFKSLPVDQKLSYFQIAGIHGYPETAWDGADPPPQDPDPEHLRPGDDPFGGYCNHNSITFPTWHRPYLLLFEQCIWNHMKDIIASWNLDDSLSSDWYNAANTWRLPYWDWARKQHYNDEFALPYAFTLPDVRIYPPAGKKYPHPYPNPFWSFENPEKGPDGKPLPMGSMPPGKEEWNIEDDVSDPTQPVMPWSKCSGVSRYGIFTDDGGKTYTGLEGVNNIDTANAYFAEFSKHWYNPYPTDHPDHDKWKTPGTLADAVNRMFSPQYNSTWGTFSSTKWWAESEKTMSTGYMSLEYIHNNVHNVSGGISFAKGGVGHMSDVPVAAFDPLFWLHHCNVDRLLAIWQALNWSYWWDTPEPGQDNVPDPEPTDPLKPFHSKDNGDPKKDFWTSDMARDWTKLSYQYDDLKPQPSAVNPDDTLNETQYILDLRAHVNVIYPNTSQLVRDVFASPSIPNKKFFGIHHEQDQTWTDYIINIVYDRYALQGRSYAILFYLGGNSNDEVSTSALEGNLIGQVYALGGLAPASGPSEGGCANCGSQRANKVLSRAQIPLSIPLMSRALDNSYGHIDNITRSKVEGYLEKHLHWKFVQIGGVEREAEEFPDTKISVWAGTGHHQRVSGDGAYLPPSYHTYTPLHAATHEKPSGLRRNDPVLGVDQLTKCTFRTK